MVAIETKFLGPTDRRGSRIKAYTCNGHSLTISKSDASKDPHADAAIALCRKLGWWGTLIKGGTKTGYVFVMADGDCFAVNPETAETG